MLRNDFGYLSLRLGLTDLLVGCFVDVGLLLIYIPQCRGLLVIHAGRCQVQILDDADVLHSLAMSGVHGLRAR
ncbi:hypothetical protein [Mycobacteroides abscessus]|uniref:hypothetical protein n=1 Tax=Mycobacteroides abscessus TaxID=36809 RepID=UPI000929F516|nr:hypothetical protein [Mycobacteroides abscessus]SHW61951.1 Uncharacterised protein [Mycobacteroides abscessus subsp. abscessus]SIE90256.1 Uncharacterised protein [Mycobacteroides abscessus subsp. abscessus]SII13491.1 Uncharacterised protein [Mycobacteroides abscessus subsp. abscessus]